MLSVVLRFNVCANPKELKSKINMCKYEMLRF